ncbi:MAG: TonB-dependent receptor [Wenzhouxiangella sp.]
MAAANQDGEERERRPLDRIVVTATRSGAEEGQNVALAVDAMGEDELRQRRIGNLDDIIKAQPKLSFAGRGPGQATVFLRGMAIQPITVLLSAAQGSSPNVAIYLDEQPVSAPGRNLDVYTTDLERVEVLPGPQGTLFGASSQAGTLRYITNKPDFGGFDAGYTGDFSWTRKGDPSQGFEGFMNIPVSDRFAARVAFYNIHRGGYIDNVEGTFTLDPEVNPLSAVDLGEGTVFTEATNSALVEDNFNDSQYRGFRLSGLYRISDEWSLMVQNTYQELEADGVFDFDPEVGDLQVTRFFPDTLEDEFNQLTWTLEGRIGALQTIYTGGYLNRSVEQSVDYTGYNNVGAFVAYYTCTYANPDYIVNYGISPDVITETRECLDPTKGTRIFQDHERHTHEFRIITPQEKRVRFQGGLFYDNLTIETQDEFHYFANMAPGALGFIPNAPMPDARSISDATRPASVAFFNDITREEEQWAVFGEVSYDFIPGLLTGTLGLRYYEIDSFFTGSSNFADGIFQGQPGIGVTPQGRGRNYDVSGGHSPDPLEQSDWVPKVTLAYTPSANMLFYATYSEGFRPGGFNRGGGLASVNPDFPTVSTTYETDDVVNYELGWKTTLFDGTLRFNGNVYFIDWTDMQVSRFDPQNVSILTFIENAADSEIFGVETDFAWRVTDGFTLHGALSYNDTELTSTDAEAIELAPVGSELPLVPTWQAAFRGRYEWFLEGQWMDYAYVQASTRYASSSFSSLVLEERVKQSSYVITDVSAGFTRGQWSLEAYIENLTDKRADLFINNQDNFDRITTNRPQTVGLRLSYRHMGF